VIFEFGVLDRLVCDVIFQSADRGYVEGTDSRSTPLMRISFRFKVGKAASGTGGQRPMTCLPVSPRIACAFRSFVVAQTAHAPRNVKSTDFMVVSKVEAITVGEFERAKTIIGRSRFIHDRTAFALALRTVALTDPPMALICVPFGLENRRMEAKSCVKTRSNKMIRVTFCFVCLSLTVGLGRLCRFESRKGRAPSRHAPITDKTTRESRRNPDNE
jgi:hypothetical protein